MTKIIGIKELQTQTKEIREAVEQGTHFIVVWRSRPVFEIRPVNPTDFVADLKATQRYKKNFLKKMASAEHDIKQGRTRTFQSTEEFLQSLV